MIRAAFRTYGGKNQLAGWIVAAARRYAGIPQLTAYVEPFCRAANVYFQLQPTLPATCRPVLADLDPLVINYLQVLRDRQPELARVIQLTPYFCGAYMLAQQPTPDAHPDPQLEAARRWYTWANQSYNSKPGVHQSRAGWQPPDARGRQSHAHDWRRLHHLPALSARLQNAGIYRANAFDLIPQLDSPTALFYLDPPYLPRVRSERWRKRAYAHEFSADDHIRLATLLHGCQGVVLLSHIPCREYDAMYCGWRRVCRPTRYGEDALYINR